SAAARYVLMLYVFFYTFSNFFFFFFFNDTPTTEIYTLSLHDALPIFWRVENVSPEQAEALLRAMARTFGGDPAATDSTRVLRIRSEEHTLNSSHDQISYAVFCLKKKKKIITTHKYKYTTDIVIHNTLC